MTKHAEIILNKPLKNEILRIKQNLLFFELNVENDDVPENYDTLSFLSILLQTDYE
jgi:hypothetical protein